MARTLKGLVFGLMVFILMAGCGKVPDLVRVKMNYTPTNLVLPPKETSNVPLYFSAFEDKRKTTDQIGENTEKGKSIPAKAPPEEVIAFLGSAFDKEFRKAGLNVVGTGDKASRLLHVRLLNFWVDEKNTFQAVVVTNIDVQDRSGRVLLTQGFRGVAQRWGSSFSEDEYRKAVSDATVEMIKSMFNNDAFMKSLK